SLSSELATREGLEHIQKQANTVNRVDLIVVGSDFYLGSTQRGRLKDGWCDFRKLGNLFVADYFGTSQVLGNTWYLNARVSPESLRGFKEHERQQIWLN